MNPRESQALFRGFFIFFILSLIHLKCGAQSLLRPACPVTGNADLCGCASVSFIINTLYCLTVYRQAALRSLKDVFEQAACVLIEAAAAGLLFFLRVMTVYHNGLLTAAVIGIVKTVGYVAL